MTNRKKTKTNFEQKMFQNHLAHAYYSFVQMLINRQKKVVNQKFGIAKLSYV